MREHCVSICLRDDVNLSVVLSGSGGGTSGRAMAFCLGRLGSNPGLDFGFFLVQNCCQSILTRCRAFSINV